LVVVGGVVGGGGGGGVGFGSNGLLPPRVPALV